MSELRLALPECKYKNDANELLKDQFIFGIENKEIQDNLLGEISESDNSVKALYEAIKIESKLAQRKLLGIVTPSALYVEAVKKGKISQFYSDYKFCGRSHNKDECPAFGKLCNACGGKNHFKAKCTQTQKRSDRTNGRKRSNRTNGKCAHRCDVHEIEECQDDSSIEDLMDQVQSLFYH